MCALCTAAVVHTVAKRENVVDSFIFSNCRSALQPMRRRSGGKGSFHLFVHTRISGLGQFVTGPRSRRPVTLGASQCTVFMFTGKRTFAAAAAGSGRTVGVSGAPETFCFYPDLQPSPRTRDMLLCAKGKHFFTLRLKPKISQRAAVMPIARNKFENIA